MGQKDGGAMGVFLSREGQKDRRGGGLEVEGEGMPARSVGDEGADAGIAA
jgi:hypothetical protein